VSLIMGVFTPSEYLINKGSTKMIRLRLLRF
jgi:hypothetical protein